ASTILFDTVDALEAANGAKLDKGAVYYGRYGTPTTFDLEDAVAQLEGGYGAITVPTGLAAISCTLCALTGAGDHILVTDSVYEPVRNICRLLLERFGVETTYYDPLIGGDIADLIRPNTKVVYMESPGSLTFEVQDVPAIAAAARAAGVRAVVDNTWATPLYFKPFDHGVDVSLHAGTKYIVGHSDAMLGVVVTTEAAFRQIRHTSVLMGHAAAPDDVYLALRGLRTLSVRLARHYETGLKLAAWLQARPEVDRVLHPALPDCPGHDIWKRDFSGSSGLFSIVLKFGDYDTIGAMVDDMHLFKMGFSWGGYESLILPANPAPDRTARGWEAPGPLLRLHIGLEDPADLIAELEEALLRYAAAAA
ncbi:MAG: cystathionine beta-lyase, partial [Sphingomonadales bacterium]|nr:cystathionine beta-lyase [Sphingomonadales bacterium]